MKRLPNMLCVRADNLETGRFDVAYRRNCSDYFAAKNVCTVQKMKVSYMNANDHRKVNAIRSRASAEKNNSLYTVGSRDGNNLL